MSAVGQCVAPMVGFSIAAQIRSYLDRFLMSPQICDPVALLEKYKAQVLESSLVLWPRNSLPSPTEAIESFCGVQISHSHPIRVNCLVRVQLDASAVPRLFLILGFL